MKMMKYSIAATILEVTWDAGTDEGTVTCDINAKDSEGNPVYLHDVPFDGRLLHPKVGDKIGMVVEKMEDA